MLEYGANIVNNIVFLSSLPNKIPALGRRINSMSGTEAGNGRTTETE
jgi:hypothetical protein